MKEESKYIVNLNIRYFLDRTVLIFDWVLTKKIVAKMALLLRNWQKHYIVAVYTCICIHSLIF